jgi:hypothetical protein
MARSTSPAKTARCSARRAEERTLVAVRRQIVDDPAFGRVCSQLFELFEHVPLGSIVSSEGLSLVLPVDLPDDQDQDERDHRGRRHFVRSQELRIENLDLCGQHSTLARSFLETFRFNKLNTSRSATTCLES